MIHFTNLAYLIAAILFILGMKGMCSPKSAPRGNMMGALGMLIAIIATLLHHKVLGYTWIVSGIIVGSGIGAYMAKTVKMTQMPQMVALFNGFGGGASLLVAVAAFMEKSEIFFVTQELPGPRWTIALVLSALIGAVTLTGSGIAWAKLEGYAESAVLIPQRQMITKGLALIILIAGVFVVMSPFESREAFYAIIATALVLGVLLVIAIGGADMPVVIALLNSYSGLAAAATGFVLMNNGLIISGSLVGASGIILTNIMCKAMNRSLVNVLFGGAIVDEAEQQSIPGKEFYEGKVKSTDADEVAMLLETAQRVVFVPGYGLAVAQAQHVTRELADLLTTRGADIKYAIHPVAGRMPGHMNVLLAEAEVPYDQLVEMDAINPEFGQTDMVFVLGANDVVNPAERDDSLSPIFGMPILDVDKAQTVVVIKRSLSPGFAGIPNQLFINDNSLMLFGDAKKVLQDMINAIKEL